MNKLPFLLAICVILTGCGIDDSNNSTKEFLIVDQDSNKVLNSYEYATDSNVLVRTGSYNSKQQVEKDIQYEYDSSGNLVKTIETVAGSPPKILTYETKTEFDAAGRLVKIIRTSSDGEVVETNFGYDEAGTLRGVVEQEGRGALLMKDY